MTAAVERDGTGAVDADGPPPAATRVVASLARSADAGGGAPGGVCCHPPHPTRRGGRAGGCRHWRSREGALLVGGGGGGRSALPMRCAGGVCRRGRGRWPLPFASSWLARRGAGRGGGGARPLDGRVAVPRAAAWWLVGLGGAGVRRALPTAGMGCSACGGRRWGCTPCGGMALSAPARPNTANRDPIPVHT